MGITTSTSYGRSVISWPDYAHEGGTALHTKIVNSITAMSDDLAIKWTGEVTLANAASTDFMHNFDMPIGELEIRIYEADALISVEEQSVNYGIVGKSGDVTNGVTITNNSGGSKTFYAYVFGFSFDKLLGREKAYVQTTDATQTVLKSVSIPTNKSLLLIAWVSSRKDGTTANAYELKYLCENNAGTVTVTQMEKTQLEDDSDWDVILVANGAAAEVKVTGEAATTIQWQTVIQKTYL